MNDKIELTANEIRLIERLIIDKRSNLIKVRNNYEPESFEFAVLEGSIIELNDLLECVGTQKF